MTIILTIEHYHAHIAPLIDGCEEKKCHAYWSETRKILKEEIIDEAKREVLVLFDAVVSFMLVPSSPNEAFKPVLIMDGQRTFMPSDLRPEQLDYLQQILPEIADPELKARVADTLWTLRHGGGAHVQAKTAISSYIASTDNLLQSGWFYVSDRLERALRIFLQLRLKNEDNSDELNVLKKIESYIEQQKSAKPPYLTIRLIELLDETHHADNERHAVILEEIAATQESLNNFDAARDAWNLAGNLHQKAKKVDDWERCQSNAAETYVKLADIAEKGEQPSYVLISSWLQSAVETYRSIPGKQQRRDEIYACLLTAQSKIQGEMRGISTEIDVSEIMKKATEAVSGQHKFIALCKFAFLLHPPKLNEIKEQMDRQAEKTPLSSMMPTTFVNRKGRVVATSSPDDPVETRMHRYISEFHRNIYTKSVLQPALLQIRLEHNISLNEWVGFIKDHPFVPPERAIAFAYGLFHGFHGDFLSAAHILIPQIENSIRYVLNNYEKQTSKQMTGGIQEESSLNQTLNIEELKEIFGEDLVFDLKGLLVEKIGENLRNTISHGLLDDDQMFEPELVYLYWLTLHIIFLPVRAIAEERKTSEADDK